MRQLLFISSIFLHEGIPFKNYQNMLQNKIEKSLHCGGTELISIDKISFIHFANAMVKDVKYKM